MARPLRISYPHAFYHVTCRGNERKAIFKDDQDRTVFLEKLQISLDIYGVRLHAYVLMNNHFHLIVETPKGNLSQFMRHFNIVYTGAYNRRHRRVGHLYQGRYKAVLVEKDSYLLELSRYVHLNPVRIASQRGRGHREQLKLLERYPWSSLGGYLSLGKRRSWMNYDEVLGYVGGSRRGYGRFIEEGVRRGYKTPWEELTGQVVLGREGFLDRVRERLDKGASKREQPSVGALESVEPQEVLKAIGRYFHLKADELRRKRTRYRDQRAVGMELMYRYSGLNQAEIGQQVGGVDYTVVSRERKRLRERMERDGSLKRSIQDLEARLHQR